MSNDWMTIEQAARLFGVHPSTMRRWTTAGRFQTVRETPSGRLLRRAEVESYASGTVPECAPESKLSVPETAHVLRVTIDELNRIVDRGLLPCRNPQDGHREFTFDDVMSLYRRLQPGKPPARQGMRERIIEGP